MQSLECATFHLNSNDILFVTAFFNSNTVADYANGKISQYGTINSQRNDFTFYNIDFKTILGTMYEKYDQFNISYHLLWFQLKLQTGWGATDRCLKINMSSLPLHNSGYHQLLGNTGFTSIGSFSLVQNTASQIYFNDDNAFSSDKPMPINNIRIYMTVINDAAPAPAVNSIYPMFDFILEFMELKKI